MSKYYSPSVDKDYVYIRLFCCEKYYCKAYLKMRDSNALVFKTNTESTWAHKQIYMTEAQELSDSLVCGYCEQKLMTEKDVAPVPQLYTLGGIQAIENYLKSIGFENFYLYI